MIVLELARAGLLRSLDVEKIRFFLGWTESPFFLSRRRPLILSLDVFRMVFSRRYARAVTVWLRYRMELYDGVRG